MLCRGSTTVRPKIIGTTVVRGRAPCGTLSQARPLPIPATLAYRRDKPGPTSEALPYAGTKDRLGPPIRVTHGCSEGTEHKRIPGNRTSGQVGTAPKPQTRHLDRSAKQAGAALMRNPRL